LFILHQRHYMYHHTNYQKRSKRRYCFTQLNRARSHHIGMVEENEKL
jgi:hypothetical protein